MRTINISDRNRRFLRRRLRRWREVFTVSFGVLVASILIVLPARAVALFMGQGRVSSEEALGLLIIAVNSTVVHLSVQTAGQWAALCYRRLLKGVIIGSCGLMSLFVMVVGGQLVLLVSRTPATRYWPEMIIALIGPGLHSVMHPHLGRLRCIPPEMYLLFAWLFWRRRRRDREPSDLESGRTEDKGSTGQMKSGGSRTERADPGRRIGDTASPHTAVTEHRKPDSLQT